MDEQQINRKEIEILIKALEGLIRLLDVIAPIAEVTQNIGWSILGENPILLKRKWCDDLNEIYGELKSYRVYRKAIDELKLKMDATIDRT